MSGSMHRAREAVVAIVLVTGSVAVLAGCSSDSPNGASTRTSGPSPSPADTVVPRSTTTSAPAGASGSTVQSPVTTVTQAVQSYLTGQGVSLQKTQVGEVKLSTVNPVWAYFTVVPAPGYQSSVQGSYGFAREQNGTWTVVTGIGSAAVGCPVTGSTTPVEAGLQTVPAAVLEGFGQSCPP